MTMIALLAIMIVFVFLFICMSFKRLQETNEDRLRLQAAGNSQLSTVRQAMSERRRQRQTQANNTHATPPRPTEDEILQRIELIKKHLFSKTIDRGPESVRSIENIPKAEQDDVYEDDSKAVESRVGTLDRERECAICLDGYVEGDTICWAKTDTCDHIFHEECAIEWLKNHDECALCRSKIVEQDMV
jgi:hypothetical protein